MAPSPVCDDESHDERSPLLSRPDDDDYTATTTSEITRSKRLTVIGLCFGLMMLLEIGLVLISTPLLEVQEDILCRRRYPAPLGEDPDCKDKNVQGELASLQSWLIVLDLVPGLAVAVPYGLVAERQGRTLVLGLSLLGITLSYLFNAVVCSLPTVLPLRLIWISFLFNFIGGGITVFSAMILSIASDVSTDEQRSTAFSYLGASMMIGAVLANPVTYWVMELGGTWVSIYAGLGLMTVLTVAAFRFPETLQTTRHKGDDDAHQEDEDGNENNMPKGGLQKLLEQSRAGVTRFSDFVRLLATEERRVGLVLLSVVLTTFGRNAASILMQYVTARFNWSWSKAGLLTSVQSLVSLLLLTVLLPAAAQLLLLRGLGPRSKDLWLARASILLQVVGAFVTGLAHTPPLLILGIVISALGFGYNLLVRGLMTSLLSHDIALLFSLIGFLETAGTVIATPLLTFAFRVGLDWGDSWLGLPFITAGVLFIGATAIVGSVSVGEVKKAVPEDGPDEAVV
ncbi:efflux pump ustT [Diplogelasinospora grovesii]|uniref:Efflux pump ustT n=1 Tax=Diplogelasinospora grovesii TaxID=303347 RepID=A0AAN6N9M7_9PEZI|nr:efflux pump ustT [Diplogelasinospora grovesii]